MALNLFAHEVNAALEAAGWSDPREEIEIGVLMENGRLAPRRFASRAEAEAWAQDGERVVEINAICDCDS